MQIALERALAELTLGPEIAADDGVAIGAWLDQHQITGADADALRRDFSRLLVYRTLVRGNLREALRVTMPRTLARLGAHFEPCFAEFLRRSPPVSRYLRDLTPQFLDFAIPRWQRDASIPAYLADLARHEALQVEVASLLARPKQHVQAELSLDEGVEFIDAVRVVEYAWAVQRLPDDELSTEPPEQSATSLLIYRSPEHDVRYLELGPFAWALLCELIVERRCLREALEHAALQIGSALDDALLTRAARLLSELAERGALLGTSRSHAETHPASAPSAQSSYSTAASKSPP